MEPTRNNTIRTCILCLCLPAIAAAAKSADADTLVIPCHVARLDYHVRAEAPRTTKTFSLSWGISSDRMVRADISLPERYYDETGIPSTAAYTIRSTSNGIDSIIAEGKAAVDYGTGRQAGFSVVLRKRDSGCVVDMGGRRVAESVVVPFDDSDSTVFICDIPEGMDILRRTLSYTSLPDAKYGQYTSVDSLMDRLSSGKDPREGIWIYLDRNTKKDKAVAGGKYTLACVRSGTGYDLIYLDGDNTGRWHPLRLKAHLEPSGFVDNFDMIWYLADGSVYEADTNASFTTEGRILECRFPEVDGMMRFRKTDDLPLSHR